MNAPVSAVADRDPPANDPAAGSTPAGIDPSSAAPRPTDGSADANAPVDADTASNRDRAAGDAILPAAEPDAAVPRSSGDRQNIRDAADVGMLLIEQLANRRIIVDEADHNMIAAADDNPNLAPDQQYKFWKSYTNIVSKLPTGEDPESIYYATCYSRIALKGGKVDREALKRVPPHTIRTVRAIRRFNFSITVFSLCILTLLIASLAYVSAVAGTAKNNAKLIVEYTNFENGRFDLTRFAGIIPNCAIGDTACVDIFEDYKRVVDQALVGTSAQLYGLLHPFSDPPQNLTFREASTINEYASISTGFLNSYLIPLLAGVLGASLSVLREVYLGFRASQVSVRAFRIAYVRMALGAISGIAVGWFSTWVSGEAEGAPFTSLVVAFAAGYAVEVIFSLLDRAAAILTGKGDPNTPAKAEGGAKP
jgi:hypothetical protein